MSLTLSLGGLTLGGGSGGGGSSLLSAGAMFTQISDGVMAEGSAPGMRNVITLALAEMSGRIMPSESHNLGRSGDSFALMATRTPFATAQVGTAPHIIMLGSYGHNDNVMNLDPAGAPGIAAMAAWEDEADLFLEGIPAGSNIRIILTTTIGSLVAGESTYAATVNAAQLAYLNAKKAADSRITVWDAWALYNHTNCTNLSPASDASRVHPDDRGARAMAFGTGSLYAVLDGLVAAATHAEIFTLYSALGTNFDADYTLKGGTTGTRTGTPQPSGEWPTGKRITSNLTDGTAVGVACSIDTADPDYYEAVAVVSGDPAATNTIVTDDTGSISATGSTPGQFFAPVVGFRIDDGAGGAPTGAMTWNIAWSNFGNLGSTADGTATLTDGIGRALDTILVCQPNPTFSSSGPFSANPALTVRFFNAALTTRIKYRRPILVQLYATARGEPVPIWKVAGEGANYVQRLTGTFSNTSTIRAEPGRWARGGLSNTTITNRKIFMTVTNSGADAVAGAGLEMADLIGSTWTWVAAGLILTRYLWLDVTVNNGVGSAVTERAGPYTIV